MLNDNLQFALKEGCATQDNDGCDADLYPTVSPVCYDDVSIHIHGHPRGGVELTVPLTIRAKLQQEFSVCVEHLHLANHKYNLLFYLNAENEQTYPSIVELLKLVFFFIRFSPLPLLNGCGNLSQ